MYLAMIVINNLRATIFLILSLTEHMYLCILQLIAFLSEHKTYLESIIIFTYLYIQHTRFHLTCRSKDFRIYFKDLVLIEEKLSSVINIVHIL